MFENKQYKHADCWKKKPAKKITTKNKVTNRRSDNL